MAKKVAQFVPAPRKRSSDVHRPANKHKRSNYKKYRGQGR